MKKKILYLYTFMEIKLWKIEIMKQDIMLLKLKKVERKNFIRYLQNF